MERGDKRMSRSIDERVVQMEFDNGSFEKNAAQSMETLDKLDEKLKFKNSRKGFEEVEKAAEKTNFSTLIKAADVVTQKLSALEVVGITALQNITNKALDAGEALVRSLSIDQITAGYSKYESKTANVQTILNSTGKSMEEVDKYLERLMWYSDETSYSFNEMLNSFATMLASGGESENLLSVITGIGNAVSYAGKGASELNSVLRYSINQAYAKGYLMTQDYQTLQTMNVDNKALRESFIEAGKTLGILDEAGKIIGDLHDTIVTAENLPSTLANKWLTKDVMETAFAMWAEYSDAVYNATKVTKEFSETREAMDALEDQYNHLAVAGFKAGQNAKTFTESIDAIKDAVSTGWMTTFELIFGKIDEATELWGNLYDFLWPIFVEGAEGRNTWLDDLLNGTIAINEEAGNISGRQRLWESIFNILGGIFDRSQAVKKAWDNLFSGPTVGKARGFVNRLFEFSEEFQLTEERAEKITAVFQRLLTPVKGLTTFLGKSGKALFMFGKKIGDFLVYFSKTDEVKAFFDLLKTKIHIGNIFQKPTNAVITFINALNRIDETDFYKVSKKITDGLKKLKEGFEGIFSKVQLKGYFSDAWNFLKEKIFDPIDAFIQKVRTSDDPFKTITDELFAGLGKVRGKISEFLGGLDFTDWKNAAGEALKFVTGKINDFAENVKEKASELDLSKILATGLTFVSGYSLIKFTKIGDQLGNLATSISGVFNKINSNMIAGNTLNAVSVNLKVISNALLKVAIAIAGLGILYNKYGPAMWNATGMLVTMTVIIGGIAIALAALSKKSTTFDLEKFKVMTEVIKKIATALLILSLAVRIMAKPISNIGWEGVAQFLATFLGMSGILIGTVFAFTKISGPLTVGILSILGVAAALVVVSKAIGALRNLKITEDEKVIGVVIAAYTGLLTLISVFIKPAQISKSMIGLLAVIGSVYLLVQTIKTLSEIPRTAFSLGNFAAIGVAFLAVLMMMRGISLAAGNVTEKWKSMISLGLGLAAMIGAMYMLVKLVKVADQLKIDAVRRSLVIVGVVGALIAGLILALGKAEQMAGGNNHYLKIAATITTLMTAIIALTAFVKIVDTLKIGENENALLTVVGMGLLISAMVLAVGKAAQLGNGKGTGYLFGLLGIIAALSAVMIALSQIKEWDKFWSIAKSISLVLVALAGVIVSVGVAVLLAEKYSKVTKKAEGKSSPWAGLLGTIIVVGGIITAILLLRDKIQNGSDLLAVGAVIAGAILSILAIIGALKMLNNMRLKDDTTKKLLAFVPMMVGLGILIFTIGNAMNTMKDIPLDGFGKRIFSILGVIAGLAVIMAGLAAITLIPGVGMAAVALAGAAFLAIAAAIGALGWSVDILGKNDLTAIGKGLKVFGKGLGAVVLPSIGLAVSALGILAFSGAIALFGLAAKGAYQPIMNLLTALNLLSNFLSAIGTAFSSEGSIWDKLAALGPAIKSTEEENRKYAEEMGALIPQTVAEAVTENSGEIKDALDTMPKNVTEIADDLKDDLKKKAEETVSEVADTVEEEIDTESEGGLFSGVKEKISGWFDDINPVNKIKNLDIKGTIENAVSGIDIPGLDIKSLLSFDGEGVSDIGNQIAGSLMSGFEGFDISGGVGDFMGVLTGSSEGLISNENSESLFTTGQGLGENVLNGFGSVDYFASGENTVLGIIEGIDGTADRLITKMSNLANSARTAYDRAMNIHSPARAMEPSGIYTVLGLVRGINDAAPKLYGAIGTMADTAVEFLVERINASENGETLAVSPVLDMDDVYSKWEGMFADGYVFHPVIQPVMDMSGVDMTMRSAEAVMYGRSVNANNGYGEAAINDQLAGMMARVQAPSQNVVINVYGAEGQDVEELADIVMSKMENAYAVKAEVYK